MDHVVYAKALGSLWGNINSLEAILRMILQKRQKLNHKYKLEALKAGDVVSLDFVTKSAYFSNLVSEFNDFAKPEHKIPWELVTLRNALAHGLMTSTTRAFPLRLVKFGKEDKANPGLASVEIADDMTLEWLTEKRLKFADALQRASKYGE